MKGFFVNYDKSERKKPSKISIYKGKILRGFKLIYNYFIGFYNVNISKPKSVDNLFLSEEHFRVSWEGNTFNKHFDPMMDFYEAENSENSLSLGMFQVNRNYYKKHRLMNLESYHAYFRINGKSQSLCFKDFKDFNYVIEKISKQIEVPSETIKKDINEMFNRLLLWEKIANFLLEEIRPKRVFLLCYYTITHFGFILAAKKRGITSIDMQHGGQGEFHPFYNFLNIPENGFTILPNVFWSWDKSSSNSLNKMFSKTKDHRTILGGNIWADYLSDARIDLNTEKKIIMYSMQTNSIPVLHDYIIKGIKSSSNEYIWWLRLHPRMKKLEIEELLLTLESENLSDKVKIDYGTETPLPLILTNCYAHLSHFSGCILEATLLKVNINVVIGEIGYNFYKELIDNKEVLYFNPTKKNNLFTYIEEIAGKLVIDNKNDESLNYKKIIKEKLI
ncbi:hypothetical protein [Polaribacter sp.]|uniref:hypothetical protein n=1 Tax=Polaribacter sp. TaxID=1920175 RepID=UPI003F4AAD02